MIYVAGTDVAQILIFSFNYGIYLAVLIMAMKSPISLLFSCTPQPILRPRDNVAIQAAVRLLAPFSFFLFVVE